MFSSRRKKGFTPPSPLVEDKKKSVRSRGRKDRGADKDNAVPAPPNLRNEVSYGTDTEKPPQPPKRGMFQSRGIASPKRPGRHALVSNQEEQKKEEEEKGKQEITTIPTMVTESPSEITINEGDSQNSDQDQSTPTTHSPVKKPSGEGPSGADQPTPPPSRAASDESNKWQSDLLVPGVDVTHDQMDALLSGAGNINTISSSMGQPESSTPDKVVPEVATSKSGLQLSLSDEKNVDDDDRDHAVSINTNDKGRRSSLISSIRPSLRRKSKSKQSNKSEKRITFSDDEDSVDTTPPGRKKKSLAWSNEMFVVSSEPLAPEQTKTRFLSEPDMEFKRGSLKGKHAGIHRSLSSMRGMKSMRIEDKKKLNMRWHWAQLLMSKTFRPYKNMLAEDDELLPESDELEGFQDEEEEEDFARVRDSMLDDAELSEREIAAFFEGFALLNVKCRSLQSQLDSLKAINKLHDARAQMMSSFRNQSAATRSTPFLNKQGSSVRALRRGLLTSSQGLGGSTRSLPTRAALLATSSTDTIESDPENETEQTMKDDKKEEESKIETESQTGTQTKTQSEAPAPVPAPAPKKQDSRPSLASPMVQRSMRKSLRELSIKKIQTDHMGDKKVEELLRELEEAEKKQKKLEKQLQQAGIVIAEDIPYEEAKSQVARIAKRMAEIGSSEVTHEDKKEQAKLREEYFKLEQDMEKYNTALMLTDEWIEEQEELEQKWEDDNAPDNSEALKKLRRHMPVDVKSRSEAQLSSELTPNGKVLPKKIAKKFKRTNVLQLLRVNPEDIVRMHPSTLENLRVTGLTLTERRAIYTHLSGVGPRWKAMQADQMTERKWTWYKMMKQNFRENLDSYLRHVQQYGPPGNHPYATRDNPDQGCPLLGKQCPLKADKLIDYDDDYGYTEEAEYEVSNVKKADKEDPGAKAMREAAELAREKKASERSDTLKKHYKGKVLQVSLANGSCESMDETMDRIDFLQQKWIENRISNPEVTDDSKRKEMAGFNDALNELKLSVLQFAERSGMQLTGKKDANADQPDIRSAIELGLCEEVWDTATDFFDGMEERMTELKIKDGRMKSTIEQLRDLLDELHERNLATLKDLGVDRPEPSRKRKSRAEILKETKEKYQPVEEVVEPAGEATYRPPPEAMPGRGGLMAAIQGRGRGRGDPSGRGGLMAAIAARGEGGGGGRGRDDGRGGLMAAIAARGRGGRGGGRDGSGGRGDLMSAIAARGRGRGRDGSAGRGDLMSAIAARGRGRGRGGGGQDGGGRGDLMAAIATRGQGRGGDGRGRGSPNGGLMAEIAARGRDGGRGARDTGGGRGDLMAAIAARGRGGRNENSPTDGAPSTPGGPGRGGRSPAGRPGPSGGRGDFLSAIQARRID